MTGPIRRAVRLSVLTPTSESDVEVTDDAVAADVVRTVVTGAGGAVPPADAGWDLVHPLHGPIPSDARLVHAVPTLTDGDVLHLTPRERRAVAAPVDDVSERAREVVGRGDAGWALLSAAVVALMLPLLAALAGLGADLDMSVVGATGLAVAVAAPVVLRGRPGIAAVTGALAVPAAAVSAGVLLMGRGASPVMLAVLVGGLLTTAVSAVAVPGRWWRPLTLLLGCALAVAVSWTGAQALVGERAPAIVVVVLLGLMAVAAPLSLRTSGLGVLDDAVAAGEAVTDDDVAPAVRRAGDDLGAVLMVPAAGVVVVAGPLAFLGPAGAGLAVTAAAIVALRARAFLRPLHVVPLLVGGLLGAVHVVLVGLVAENGRAVPLFVGALIVLVMALGAAVDHGVAPVTAGRWRRIAQTVETLLVVAVPLLVAGVFDLYRAVWERV